VVPQTSSQAICAAILPYAAAGSGQELAQFGPLKSGINVERGEIVHPR
jgi:alanine dehydrogenase